MKQAELKYTPEQIDRAMSQSRWGGVTYFSICGAGETTLQNEIADITYSILKNGHYVNITTNGTIGKRLKEIVEKAGEGRTMKMKERIVTVGHLMLNAVDTFLIQVLLGPMTVKKMHISFDDVHESLVDINENKYSSIFDNSFFSSLKKLNTTYNAKFSLYLFEDENLVLKPSVIQELEDCKSWLSVGYHAHLDDKANLGSFRRFQKCFCEKGLISKACRIHEFTADRSLIYAMYEAGIRELLCADDGRLSYGVPSELYGGGYSRDGINYTPTDVRLERFCFRRLSSLKHKDRLIIFAHEKPFKRYCEIQKLEAILRRLPKDIEFDY